MKKKLIAIVSVVMLLMLLMPLNSFGARDRECEEKGCLHPSIDTLSVEYTYVQNNIRNHKVIAHIKDVCCLCGVIIPRTQTYYDYRIGRLIGQCNGSTTTETTVCRYCNYIIDVTTFPCRNAGCRYSHDVSPGSFDIVINSFCCKHDEHCG